MPGFEIVPITFRLPALLRAGFMEADGAAASVERELTMAARCTRVFAVGASDGHDVARNVLGRRRHCLHCDQPASDIVLATCPDCFRVSRAAFAISTAEGRLFGQGTGYFRNQPANRDASIETTSPAFAVRQALAMLPAPHASCPEWAATICFGRVRLLGRGDPAGWWRSMS
jgi:hypothetical protein